MAANGSPDSGKLAVYIFFKARHPGHDGALLCRHHAPPAPSLWASSASLMHGLTQSNFNFEEFSMFYQIRDLGSIYQTALSNSVFYATNHWFPF